MNRTYPKVTDLPLLNLCPFPSNLTIPSSKVAVHAPSIYVYDTVGPGTVWRTAGSQPFTALAQNGTAHHDVARHFFKYR